MEIAVSHKVRFIIIGAFAPNLHSIFHSQFSIHDPLKVTEMMKKYCSSVVLRRHKF